VTCHLYCRYTSTKCAPGYYCKLGVKTRMPNEASCPSASDVCDGAICPVGHYCPTGTADPIRCAAGSYNSNTGAANCTACPAGYYCDGANTTTYEPCPQGHYCPEATGLTQPTCPLGTYGTATSLSKSRDCTPCDAGMHCSARGLTAPSGACAAGYYCPTGSRTSFGEVRMTCRVRIQLSKLLRSS
jgi:hypothetical protein